MLAKACAHIVFSFQDQPLWGITCISLCDDFVQRV